MFKRYHPQSILITGASSGIGRALALEYADIGITEHLCGRNLDRLNDVAQECREKGATVFTYLFDTTDQKKPKKP